MNLERKKTTKRKKNITKRIKKEIKKI